MNNNEPPISAELNNIINKSRTSVKSLNRNARKALNNANLLKFESTFKKLLNLYPSTNNYNQIEMYLRMIGNSNNYCIIFKTFGELQSIISSLNMSKGLFRRWTSKVTRGAKSLASTLKRNSSLIPCDESIIDYNNEWNHIRDNEVQKQKELVRRLNEYLNNTKCIANICDGKKILIILHELNGALNNNNVNKLSNLNLSELIQNTLLLGVLTKAQILQVLVNRQEPLFVPRQLPVTPSNRQGPPSNIQGPPSTVKKLPVTPSNRQGPPSNRQGPPSTVRKLPETPEKSVPRNKKNNKNNKTLENLNPTEYFTQIKKAVLDAIKEIGPGSVYDDTIYKKYLKKFESTYKIQLRNYSYITNMTPKGQKFYDDLIAFLDNLFSTNGGKREGQKLMNSLITSELEQNLENLSPPNSNGTLLVVQQRKKNTSRVASHA